jgi:hypothetical protein
MAQLLNGIQHLPENGKRKVSNHPMFMRVFVGTYHGVTSDVRCNVPRDVWLLLT